MIVKDHHDVDELKTMIRKQSDPRTQTRMRIVVLALQGKTAKQISEVVFYSHRSVQSWIKRYNSGGVKALKDQPRSGRPKKLNKAQERRVRKFVSMLRGTDQRSVGEATRVYVRTEMGVRYSLDGIYKLINRLGV